MQQRHYLNARGIFIYAVCELWLDGIVELSHAAAESLSKHKGMINDMDPKEWVESL